jgi:hypothetical protein
VHGKKLKSGVAHSKNIHLWIFTVRLEPCAVRRFFSIPCTLYLAPGAFSSFI